MKKIYILSIFALLVFASCKKEGQEPEPLPQVDDYHFIYMDYGEQVFPNYENKGIVTIQHLNGKIVKRNGGLISVNPATGYSYKFFKNVFDTVIYNNTEIQIKERFIYDEGIYFIKDQSITIDKKGRMSKKISPYTRGSHLQDTLVYSYNSKGQITEINGSHSFYHLRKSLFYYNTKSNIDSVVTTFFPREDRIIDYKRVDIFSDYDDTKNPLKELVIFDETFYRSISANNYRFWRAKEYDMSKKLISDQTKSYNLKYDENGNVLFNSY